jgi:hypothetical protein
VPQVVLERWPAPRPFHCASLDDAWARRTLLLCAADFTALPGYASALLEALSNRLKPAFLDNPMSSSDNWHAHNGSMVGNAICATDLELSCLT